MTTQNSFCRTVTANSVDGYPPAWTQGTDMKIRLKRRKPRNVVIRLHLSRPPRNAGKHIDKRRRVKHKRRKT